MIPKWRIPERPEATITRTMAPTTTAVGTTTKSATSRRRS